MKFEIDKTKFKKLAEKLAIRGGYECEAVEAAEKLGIIVKNRVTQAHLDCNEKYHYITVWADYDIGDRFYEVNDAFFAD